MAQTLAFFGHDAHDPAVQRRIQAFSRAGAEVIGFTMRRGPALETAWRNVDLGPTRDAAMAQRLGAMASAAPVLAQHARLLRTARVFYARNLDMLALAHWARMISGARAKLIYECLDVHRFMTRDDAIGASFRTAERALLGATEAVVISSPAFEREYFAQRHPGHYRARLIENRLPPGFDYGPRPSPRVWDGRMLRIGWFGNLRCRRSLDLLLTLADRFPNRVTLSLHGAPAEAEFVDFAGQVAGRANVTFGGRYAWPNDLARLYGDVDVVWAGDFHDADANSKWLLPNRLYEGGYYGVPPIAPADSETGRWIGERVFGFTLTEPLGETLPAFVAGLTPAALSQAQAALAAAPASVFVQDDAELAQLLADIAGPERGG